MKVVKYKFNYQVFSLLNIYVYTIFQTMVFVHARNDTVRTAMVLRDMAKNKNEIGFFLPEQSRQYGEAQKTVSTKQKLEKMITWGK